jgi:hypothetical protein
MLKEYAIEISNLKTFCVTLAHMYLNFAILEVLSNLFKVSQMFPTSVQDITELQNLFLEMLTILHPSMFGPLDALSLN